MAAPVPERIVPFQADDSDAERKRKKDRAKAAPKTLLIVLETLVGKPVDIELRNDTEINGTLESVDREMKCASPPPCRTPGWPRLTARGGAAWS